MDAVSMLGGDRETPLDLTGLSPEEIRGVSAGRIGREQMMSQMVNLLAGQRGRESTIASQEEARKSSKASRIMSEEKLRQLKAGDEDMIITGLDDKPYQIKRRNLTESLKYMDMAKHRAKQGELTDEQIKSLQERVPMKIRDAAGKEEIFQVPLAQHSAVAKTIEEEKKARARTEALERFKGKKIEDLSDMDLADIVTLGGTGVLPALANRVSLAGESMGLSDAHYRHYAKLYADYSTHVLKRGGPDALIETINGMGRKLGHNHMLLNISSPSLWGVSGRLGFEKTVTVSLPPNKTPDMIYKDAEELGVPVSDILQRIYERQQK